MSGIVKDVCGGGLVRPNCEMTSSFGSLIALRLSRLRSAILVAIFF